VLVADDHGPDRRLVALSLAPIALVLEARQGREAIELARALEPDLVILDLTMPGGPSGLDTCRALRADPATARVPVVICTASTRPGHARACAEAGADAFLLKPYRTRVLVELVLSLVPTTRPRQAAAAVPI
jgi:CheY-like chemotaxis protein